LTQYYGAAEKKELIEQCEVRQQ